MATDLVTAKPGWDAAEYLTREQQEAEFASLKGTRVPVTLHLEANDGDKVAKYVTKGSLINFTKTSAEFESIEGKMLPLPLIPRATAPVNLCAIMMGHSTSTLLAFAQSLHTGEGQELRLLNFSNWYELYSATDSQATRNDFLATLGHLLGVRLYPRAAAVPSLQRADQAAHDQRIMVAILLASLSQLDMLLKNKTPITSHMLLPAELAMTRLLVKHWRKDRKSDADKLELDVVERGLRIGAVVEALEVASRTA